MPIPFYPVIPDNSSAIGSCKTLVEYRGYGKMKCVFEAPGSAGVYVADLNLDKLRAHRSQDIMGDKYRHPHKYGILADENVRDVIGGDFVHW